MTPKHYKPLDEERGPRPVGESLDRVVPGARAFSTLVARWPDIVGASLAARVRPKGLHGGTLVIAADDGASLTSARWMEADLLARIQEAVGAGSVASLRFVVQPV
jgi:predicted nucleic acid-binding Zn ribbon protein